MAPFGELLVRLPTATEGDGDDDTETDDAAAEPLNSSDSGLAGMQALEDAAADSEHLRAEAEGTANMVFTRTVTHDSREINTARLLSETFKYMTSPSLVDRLRQINGETRFGFKATAFADELLDEMCYTGPRLSVQQPIVTLVSCNEHFFLLLAEVNLILYNSSLAESLPVSLLGEKVVQIGYQGLCLIPNSIDGNSSGTHDWMSSGFLTLSKRVPGALVQPVNPDISTSASGSGSCLFESSVLMSFTLSLLERVNLEHTRQSVPSMTIYRC
ncbi:unnamed protein product [Peniophora sp. CBMAI 1063]|nr:unnamed protein product [Peniophora sp. CBMAI 1063]